MGKEIITILHTESSIGWGGQEMRILLESQELIKRGFRVILACNPRGRIADRAERAGLSVYRVGMHKHLSLISSMKLFRIMKKEKVRILNTHSSIDSWLASPAARFAGIPVIRTKHVGLQVKKSFLTRILYVYLCDRIMTAGMTLRQMFIDKKIVTQNKIVSIPTGVDENKYSPHVSGKVIRDEFKIRQDQPLIGIIAVIRHGKGHKDFLSAANEVLKINKECRFIVVGELSEKKTSEDILSKMKELQLKDKIIMTGHRDDISLIIASLDILVSCSYYEGIPQSILQALASAKPVIATDVGSCSEVIKDGETGILIQPGDFMALSKGIISLIKDRDYAGKLGKNGREFVLKNFSVEKMAGKVENLYRDLLEQ